MATITDQIRQTLAKRDGISEAAMRPLAATYASEVARVNDRLSSAVELLQKGLRSEAIQAVSITPNAIDNAAKLDFPDGELEDWFDILQFLDVPVPPSLNRDLVDQLNEAIIETQPLEGLLKRHRRLAIARAPLAWRLKVLRRIAEVDTSNGVWEDDLEIWEKVRHKQIAGEASELIAAANPERLRGLHDELTQTAWHVQPDARTVKQVIATLTGLKETETLRQLKIVAPKINDAFCEFNEPSARNQMSHWNDLVGRLSSPLPCLLNEQVEPARLWLAEVDRETEARHQRALAVGQLESTLDRKASLEDLEKAYQQTTLFDEPPPEEMVQRYWVSVEERKLTQKRRFQLAVAAIVSIAGMAMATIVWWQVDAAFQTRVAAAESEFQSLLDAADHQSATSFYQSLQQLNPKVAATSVVTSLAGQMETQIEADNKRAMLFDHYLAEADAKADSDIDISALNRAEAISATDEEKGRAYTLRRRHSQWASGVASAETEQFLASLSTIRDRLAKIERGEPDETATLGLGAILDELGTLMRSFPRADSTARFQLPSVRSRVISMRNAIAARSKRLQAEALTMQEILSAQSLDEFAASLKMYSTQAPESAMAEEFQRVAEERPLWEKALAWNDYVESVSQALRSPLSSDSVKSVHDAAMAMKLQIHKLPMELPSSAMERFDRHDDRTSILQRVLGDLPGTVIADLFTVVEADGLGKRHFVYKTYYDRERTEKFAPSPVDRKKSVGIEVVTNDSGAVATKPMVGDFVVHQEPYRLIRDFVTIYETRHSQILADWDGEFLKLAADLRKRANLDGQIKEMLLQHLLSGACEGSEYLSKHLVNELRWMKGRASNVSTWYEPSESSDRMVDGFEDNVVPQLANLYRGRSTAQSDLAQIRKLLFKQVGLLVRRSNGDIVVKPIGELPADCNLAIVRPSPHEQDKVDWLSIGRVQSGQVSLTDPRDDLVAGRPVFSYPK